MRLLWLICFTCGRHGRSVLPVRHHEEPERKAATAAPGLGERARPRPLPHARRSLPPGARRCSGRGAALSSRRRGSAHLRGSRPSLPASPAPRSPASLRGPGESINYGNELSPHPYGGLPAPTRWGFPLRSARNVRDCSQ